MWGKICLKNDGKKSPAGSACPFIALMHLFLSVFVDDMKMAKKSDNVSKLWATLQKKVDLEDPASLLHQKYLGYTQRAEKVHNRIVMQEQKWFS